MDYRPPPGLSRPAPPQRAVSGSYAVQQGLRRPPLPSRLQNVRSVSQPGGMVDVPGDGSRVDVRNTTAFLSNSNATTNLPGAINPTAQDDSERPLKRAKIGGHGFRGTGEGGEVATDRAHRTVPGSPLPTLPAPTTATRRNAQQTTTTRPGVDRAARKANGLEPPSIATRVPQPKNVADFSPWHGQHPEDTMSEIVVKQGYSDKAAGPNSTETNSARTTIWPNLSQKNMMGLQTLSYLFTSVMEKRQLLGKCTAPSTFKPPPRVTVTDTKREAWLRDLANPDVPLRKQSRTIPHGIRGKSLMEQCLSKDIPMPRAVWLAKCVGANELRAFRRKGVSGAAAASGESKWVMEWTVHVEQFLEGVIASCGQPDWQAKMDYAVKLATSFYTERLLERDHYLDWIVSSFAEASMETLPTWLIMVQLYWKDILAFGRRGRQLAEAALENLHQISMRKTSIHDALKDRLKKLIAIMAVTNRGCLVVPRTWEKYKYLLVPRMTGGNTTSHAHNVARRNTRLTAPLLQTPRNIQCALLKLYAVLDTTGLKLDLAELTADCIAIVPDVPRLVSAILDWSASMYRTGTDRIYLAAGVVAQLRRAHDTDAAIMQYLRSGKSTALGIVDVHRVIAELVRTEAFSTGRYLQWLMTSGALSVNNGVSPATSLLNALPTNSLQPHLLNTRNMLLRRLGLLKNESRQIDEIFQRSDPARWAADVEQQEVATAVDALSVSAKLELALRITSQAVASGKLGHMTLEHFCIVREIIERCDDARALADLAQSAMHCDDTILLATVCDTLNMHAKSLAAIGRLNGSLVQIFERYSTVRSQQPLDRAFILALRALSQRFPERAHMVKLLDQDMTICEQQNLMVVCSPASDSIVNMQASTLASDDDIDAVFASGNNMDEQLMQRVFARVVQRLNKTMQPDATAPSKVCGWLSQLRAVVVDPASFEQMAVSHVQACLENAGEDMAPCKIIVALVAGGCMNFDTLVNTAIATKKAASACLAIRLLTSRTAACEGLHPTEAYRYHIQQELYCSEKAEVVMSALVSAMEDSNFPAEDPAVVDLVLRYSVDHHDAGYRALASHPRSTALLANCSRITTKLLSLGNNPAAIDSRLDAKSIIDQATPLSIVQCSAALRLYSTVHPDEAEHVQKAVLEAVVAGSEVWPQLLESAGNETVRGIYGWAKEQVLNNALPSSTSFEPLDEASRSRNLDILDVAIHAAKEQDVSAVIATVTDKLRAFEIQISSSDSVGSFKSLLASLHILLHLAVLYGSPTSESSGSTDRNDSQALIGLLTSLCALLIHPKLQTQTSLLEYIYDVASALSDSLQDTVLSNLAKNVPTKDPRLASILGSTANPDAWLAIVSNPSGSMTGAAQGARAGLMRSASGVGTSASGLGIQQLSPQQMQQAQFTGRPLPLNQQQGQAAHLQQAQMQAAQRSPGQQFSPSFAKPGGAVGGSVRSVASGSGGETKIAPYPLRRWEIMSDATPVVGGNDTSLSLGLFGARKV
ncbi:unnamed protein product [Zymoseptoria tritici ST99CH_3D1]|nr:unnamed protein product [Zymoseptoria tritici ST99CH_3D1]